VVLMDEAQVFEQHIGAALSSFLKESRKMGVSIFFLTQNPTSHSLSSEIKGEIHNVIAFHLSPANIRELTTMTPDIAEMEDVIRRRPIGGYMGVAVALVGSQHFPAVIKTPRFEDVKDTMWNPQNAVPSILDDAIDALEAADGISLGEGEEASAPQNGIAQLDLFESVPQDVTDTGETTIETLTAPVPSLVGTDYTAWDDERDPGEDVSPAALTAAFEDEREEESDDDGTE